jgi:hypothetical protein
MFSVHFVDSYCILAFRLSASAYSQFHFVGTVIIENMVFLVSMIIAPGVDVWHWRVHSHTSHGTVGLRFIEKIIHIREVHGSR